MRRGCVFCFASVLMAVVNLAGCASYDVSNQFGQIAQGAVTKAPHGFVRYCRASIENCQFTPKRAATIQLASTAASSDDGALFNQPSTLVRPVALSDTRWRELKKLNTYINVKVQYRTDMESFGLADYWRAAENFGDCEDFALAKKKALIERGWPKEHLRLMTTYSVKTGLHAVLVVTTDKGDFLLDNVEPRIRPWNKSKYIFLKIQTPNDPKIWRRALGPAPDGENFEKPKIALNQNI